MNAARKCANRRDVRYTHVPKVTNGGTDSEVNMFKKVGGGGGDVCGLGKCILSF